MNSLNPTTLVPGLLEVSSNTEVIPTQTNVSLTGPSSISAIDPNVIEKARLNIASSNSAFLESISSLSSMSGASILACDQPLHSARKSKKSKAHTNSSINSSSHHKPKKSIVIRPTSITSSSKEDEASFLKKSIMDLHVQSAFCMMKMGKKKEEWC